MSCKDQARLLDAYIDGELDLAAALAVDDHVQSCAHCKAALAKLGAVRAALRSRVPLEPAPSSLRERLAARFAPRAARPGWAWWGLAAAPGIAALALALWLALAPAPAHLSEARVVYHMASSANAGAALRTLGNHLNASPGVKVVVVAHNEGIDFLLRGARDESGQPLEPVVRSFRERGVEFRVCHNTLERRRIGVELVIPAAAVVPSGIAEVGRLQSREGYTYMRL